MIDPLEYKCVFIKKEFIHSFKLKGSKGFGYESTAEEVTKSLSLLGKTILVTGCNSGLGKETMRVLKLRGGEVIGTGRAYS